GKRIANHHTLSTFIKHIQIHRKAKKHQTLQKLRTYIELCGRLGHRNESENIRTYLEKIANQLIMNYIFKLNKVWRQQKHYENISPVIKNKRAANKNSHDDRHYTHCLFSYSQPTFFS